MNNYNIGDIVEIMYMAVSPYHYGEVVEIRQSIHIARHSDLYQLRIKHFAPNDYIFTTLALSDDIILIVSSDQANPNERGDIIRVLNQLR